MGVARRLGIAGYWCGISLVALVPRLARPSGIAGLAKALVCGFDVFCPLALRALLVINPGFGEWLVGAFVFLRSLVFYWGLVGGLIVLGLDRVLWWALLAIGVVLGEGLITTAFGLL